MNARIMRFMNELRRRRVMRVAGLYVVGAWLALQAADVLLPGWGVPEESIRYLFWAALLGFPVALVFGWIFQVTPEGIRRTRPEWSEAELDAAVPLRRMDYVILSAFVAVIGLIGYDATSRVLKSGAGHEIAMRTDLADDERQSIRRLAVLPFSDSSAEPGQEYFADGITDALIGKLSQIRELRVISRSSAMRFKGSDVPPMEIARELNVDAVVEGHVARVDGAIRLTVELIDARTDSSLWLREYERDPEDILQLQGDITAEIGEAVRVQITPEERVRLEGARPVNPQAYEEYLRGKFYAGLQTREDNDAAIHAFGNAVEIDPDFAPAHAELAQAYLWKLFLFSPGERRWQEKAFMSAEKALSLDPDSGLAYLARGRLLWTPANRFPHELAIGEYRRALALNPELDEARNQLALIYSHIGLFDEALHEAGEALAINPGNSLLRYREAQTLVWQREYEQALSILRALPEEVNPALVGYQTAWALFNLGRTDEAAVRLERLLNDYPDDTGGLYTSIEAVMAASTGRRDQALELIALAHERGRGFGHFHHTAYQIGVAYALMNEPEQAVNWLRYAAENGFPCYPLYARDHNLDSLREDLRFVEFMANLRRQWEHFQTL
ncbi:MAG TPA: tetratricopeptide repeat protein [Gammaproteobacteria bacterium]|nr:tetratricopeptide repeat protein [Gammaproteobacteria bacterium]